ncbi:MAG: CAP domain-containing protein [bacterium]|nr:CAP domain-containing protein [bacterium]
MVYNNKLAKNSFKLSLLVILLGIFLLPKTAYLSAITPEKLIELTNQERTGSGLNTLTANQLLTKAAILKGRAILENNTFGHTINNQKFSSWIKDAGYNYSYAGENLAIDFISSEGVIDAWNNSPAHRKNLLSPYYQEIGVAAIEGKFQGQNTIVVIQEFGAPAAVSVQPLAQKISLNNLSADLIAPEYGHAENLLSHSILGQELKPLHGSKIILPAVNYQTRQPNTFFIQANFSAAPIGFILIFTFLTLTYLLIFLYYYYFFKINKLISA